MYTEVASLPREIDMNICDSIESTLVSGRGWDNLLETYEGLANNKYSSFSDLFGFFCMEAVIKEKE